MKRNFDEPGFGDFSGLQVRILICFKGNVLFPLPWASPQTDFIVLLRASFQKMLKENCTLNKSGVDSSTGGAKVVALFKRPNLLSPEESRLAQGAKN